MEEIERRLESLRGIDDHEKFHDILKTIPKDLWKKLDPHRYWTLLHYACFINGNVKAVIMLSEVYDVNIGTVDTITPAHAVCWNQNVQVLEILCVLGADFRETKYTNGVQNLNPLDVSLRPLDVAGEPQHGFLCSKVLIANGMRITVKDQSYQVPQELWDFQAGVVQCRDVIVILLGLKKRRISTLQKLDRFLIREVLAVEIWTTRTKEKWYE